MPIVKFPVRRGYLEKASKLAKKANLGDVSDWERKRIHILLVGSPNPGGPGLIGLYKSWEDLHEITDIRTISKNNPEGKKVDFEFEESHALSLQGRTRPGKGEMLRGLDLKSKTLEWLAKGLAFSRDATKTLNKSKSQPPFQEGFEARTKSVNEFLSLFLQAEATREDIVSEFGEID